MTLALLLALSLANRAAGAAGRAGAARFKPGWNGQAETPCAPLDSLPPRPS